MSFAFRVTVLGQSPAVFGEHGSHIWQVLGHGRGQVFIEIFDKLRPVRVAGGGCVLVRARVCEMIIVLLFLFVLAPATKSSCRVPADFSLCRSP